MWGGVMWEWGVVWWESHGGWGGVVWGVGWGGVRWWSHELLPPHCRQQLAWHDMTANGWSSTPPVWPLANDDFALMPLLAQLFSRALVYVQEENLRQVGDADVAGFIRGLERLAC